MNCPAVANTSAALLAHYQSVKRGDVPEKGNSALSAAVRRGLLFDRAAEVLGRQGLADAIGMTRRAVNHKMATDRGVTDGDLSAAADAVEAYANTLTALVRDLRGTIA